MSNTTNNKAESFIKGEVLKMERNSFIITIIILGLVYTGTSIWLNSVRDTTPSWFLWVLIIIQFIFYFLIFITSFRRAIVCGLNNIASIFIFATLIVLGRINDWELIIIPLTIISMIIVSIKNKRVSNEKKHLVTKDSNK